MSSAGRWAVAVGTGLVVSVGYLVPMLASLSQRGSIAAVILGLCAAIGVFLLRSVKCPSVRVAVPAIAAALLVAMSVPLTKDGYPEVSVTATGQKAPKSNSSEVYVRLLSEPVRGLRDFEGEGWEKRGDVFVSYQKQPNVLHYHGTWSSGAALRIVRHPYSGIAEVSIGGKTQRLDLYAEKESFVDVPLPEASVSWKGYLQRAVIVVGLGLLFTAAGMMLTEAFAAWGLVLMLALLAGCASLWLVKDRSYAGLMEVVAFAASSEPTRVEMDAGHGFTPALVVPVKSGTAVTSSFSVPNPRDWRIGIEGGSLRVFRELDAPATSEAVNDSDNGCAVVSTGRCVYEVQGAGLLRIWLQAGSEQKALTLPASAEGGERLFLLVEREPGRIAVSASRAHLELSPWDHFSGWITALRVVGQDGKSAGKLVRLLSDSVGSYKLAPPAEADGAFRVPTLQRPDTGSFVTMKVFAGLIGASFVLLIAAAVKIALALVCSFKNGRRVQVLASVFGCLGWLGASALVAWPAIIGWDGFSPYTQAQTGVIMLWYGLGYPLIMGGFLQLGSGVLVTLWSVLATVVLLLGTAALLLRRGTVVVSWLAPVMLCVVLPFTVVMVGMMTQLRDAMNGLMLAMFAFCGFYTALKWTGWTRSQRNWVLAGLMLGGAVLSMLRVDNIPTLLILAGGLAIGVRGLGVRPVAFVAVAIACWITIGVQVERFTVPDREGRLSEKRLYGSTAVINPLTGVLVHGKDRIPDTLYADIHDTLNKVMDVDFAVQHWSPYNIIYWHRTYTKRGIPSVETNDHLRGLYLDVFKADPVLFIKLRLATFGAVMGHEWFEPENYQKANGSGLPIFPDHLLTTNPTWQHALELLGYAPKAHMLPEKTQALLEWEGKIASTLPQLIICLVVALRFRRSPLAAVVALGEIVRAGLFFLLEPASVLLYLYDMHLLGFLLPMLALIEQSQRASVWATEGVQ